jgi:hypothetical protein
MANSKTSIDIIGLRSQSKEKQSNDEVRFVQDQHAELDLNSASSLKQQSSGRHVAPLGHIFLIYLYLENGFKENCYQDIHLYMF